MRRSKTDLPPKKYFFGLDGVRSVKRQLPEGPSSRRSSLVGPNYPTDSQLQVYDIYIIRRVLLADHARDVNILIWTSPSQSVMKQMIALWSMVKVHGLMVAGPGVVPNKPDIGARDPSRRDLRTENQM